MSLEYTDAQEGANISTMTSTRVGQRGEGGCGLGVHTERMALRYTYSYIYIYIFRKYKLYFMTLRLFGTPSEYLIPCIKCIFVYSGW